MWWLHAGSSREQVHLSPGVYKLPPWYGPSEARGVALALATLLSKPQPWIELPLEMLCVARAGHEPHGVILVQLRREGAPGEIPSCCADAWVLVAGLTAVEQSELSWLGQIRDRMVSSLNLALSWRHHPIQLAGGGNFLGGLVSQRCADPAEMLDVLDRAVRHRVWAGGGDEADWARSVERAAGEHVADRLSRIDRAEALDALRVIVGLEPPELGVRAGERLGLLRIVGGRVRVQAVARGLADGDGRGGLSSAMGALPLDLRRALVGEGPILEPPQLLGTPPPRSEPGLSCAIRENVERGQAFGAEADWLLKVGLAALRLAEAEAHWREAAQLPAWGEVLRSLDELASGAPPLSHLALGLAAALRVASVWHPSHAHLQERAIIALRRLSEAPTWGATLRWALLRRAFWLIHGAITRQRLSEAELLIQEVAAARDVGIAAQVRVLEAELAWARGQADDALDMLQLELQPAFARLPAPRFYAQTSQRIAEILYEKGEIDAAIAQLSRAAIPTFAQMEMERDRLVALCQLAEIRSAFGDKDDALRVYRFEAIPSFKALGAERDRADTSARIADILLSKGELEEAMRIYREDVLPVYEQLEWMRGRIRVLSRIARAREARGEVDEALRVLHVELLPLLAGFGERNEILWEEARLAHLLLLRGAPGDRDEANALLARTLNSADARAIAPLNAWLHYLSLRYGIQAPAGDPSAALRQG